MEKAELITITGPTASGKTSLAAHLAHQLGAEIISADSRQVYREMNLGTGKDYEDYQVDGQTIPCHLIDLHEPGYKYNVFEFQKDFKRAFDNIKSRGNIPMLVGGTGMYIEAVTKGYALHPVPADEQLRQELQSQPLDQLVITLRNLRPDLHNTTDTKNKKRTIRAIEIATYYQNHPEKEVYTPPVRQVIFGIKHDRGTRRRRISERLRSRLNSGMIDEVKQLLEKVAPDDLIFYGLEYKFITLYLTGKLSRTEMEAKLEIAIHQFAKRQMTWFRKMEREGTHIHWLAGDLPLERKLEAALKMLKNHGF